MDFTAKHLFVNRRVKMLPFRSQLGVTVETQASLLAMTTTVAICALGPCGSRQNSDEQVGNWYQPDNINKGTVHLRL